MATPTHTKHSTDGVSPFANVALSDEVATKWADGYDEYEQSPLRIGNHRQDILGITFDFDQLIAVPDE